MTTFSFFDDTFEPVLIEDLTGKVVYFNSSLLSFFKLSPRYFKKQEIVEDFFTEFFPGFDNFLKDLRSMGNLLTPEISFTLDEQTYTVIVKASKFEDHYLYFIKDMSVEKQLYDKYKLQMIELRNSHAQILQSDKLKVVGEMTANISHEINNPLTVVMGNSEMIEFSLEANDLNLQRNDLKKFNSNISLSVSRIMSIIANMKEFLHKSEDLKEYWSAKEVVNASLSFLNPTINRFNIAINVESEESEPIIFINKIKMEQVLINIIQNALDAVIDSKTNNPQIKITINSKVVDGHIAIDIADNGPGISDENLEQIFTTFFTTKEVGKGTGLGLSIANRILESHQGKIEVIKSGIGATFRIILPSVGISSYVSGEWEKMYSGTDNLKKILIVDNEPSILNLCMNFLKNSDFYFLGSTNAQEALTQIKRVNVDLIITDVKMPGISGEKFVRMLRESGINTPVLYMTSKDSISKFNDIKNELKISGLIVKPFTKDEFINSIESGLYDKKKI